MSTKVVDRRVKNLLKNCYALKHRSLLVIIGKHGHQLVPTIHHLFHKVAGIKPSILWCYENLSFNVPHLQTDSLDKKSPDTFYESSLSSLNIHYSSYSETKLFLDQTFNVAIMQDYESLTPSTLAHIFEIVEGGGLIALLLQSVSSLEELCSKTMGACTQCSADSREDIACRFSKRFVSSLSSHTNCLIIDDQFNVLPQSLDNNLKSLSLKTLCNSVPLEKDEQLNELCESLQDTQPVGTLMNLCRTFGQSRAVLKFIESLTERCIDTTVSLTSARGRGKSAALGLGIAGAIALGYRNIFVTAPQPENLKIMFLFLIKGLDALGYKVKSHYRIIRSSDSEIGGTVIEVNVFREYRQFVRYVCPSDAKKMSQVELLVIDEAAAMPFSVLKTFLGPYVTFLTSTNSGYEKSGSSLISRLSNELHQRVGSMNSSTSASSLQIVSSVNAHAFCELKLDEPILYSKGDPVEVWLNRLLCLNGSIPKLSHCPAPQICDLYYINRDVLFSYCEEAEIFLQHVMEYLTSTQYECTSDNLLAIADDPQKHLFCLVASSESRRPEILCVMLVSTENDLECDGRMSHLISPCTSCYQDPKFQSLSHIKIIKIAAHPEYQRMGYGSRALQLLLEYFKGQMFSLDDSASHTFQLLSKKTNDQHTTDLKQLKLQKSSPSLLFSLTEREPERIDYMSVTFGLRSDLLRFWKKAAFIPVYLHHIPDSVTGEHKITMLKPLSNCADDAQLFSNFHTRFCFSFVRKLSEEYLRLLPLSIGIDIILNENVILNKVEALSKEELDCVITPYGMKCLQQYCNTGVNLQLITGYLSTLAKYYFLHRLENIFLDHNQKMILFGMGLQGQTVDEVAHQLNMNPKQILGLLTRTLIKINNFLNSIIEKAVRETMVNPKCVKMEPAKETLEEELRKAAKEIEAKQKQEAKRLREMDFSEYCIRGSEDEWQKALLQKPKTHITIKSVKRPAENNVQEQKPKRKKDKKRYKK